MLRIDAAMQERAAVAHPLKVEAVQVFRSELGVAVDAKQGEMAVLHVFRILLKSMICKRRACARSAASGSLVSLGPSRCARGRFAGCLTAKMEGGAD